MSKPNEACKRLPLNAGIYIRQIFTFKKHVSPKRCLQRLFTYGTLGTRASDVIFSVKKFLENADMAFEPLVQPARPRLYKQDLFSFFIYITYCVVWGDELCQKLTRNSWRSAWFPSETVLYQIHQNGGYARILYSSGICQVGSYTFSKLRVKRFRVFQRSLCQLNLIPPRNGIRSNITRVYA